MTTTAYREEHDLAYYEPDWVGSGDAEYRQERCKLDLHCPTQAGFSTIVWFHGGGLQAGEKELPAILKYRGMAVIVPNYRLSSPRAKCPDYLEDAAAAVAWVLRHIAEYGGDPAKVYVSGGSGGGYLAAMLGLDPAYLARHGLSHRQLAGVMPVSGQMTTHFQIVNERSGMMTMAPNAVPVIDAYAPLFHIHKDAPPLVLVVGDPAIEWPGRPEENKLLAALLTRIAGHPQAECISLPGFDHGDIYDPGCLLMLKKIQELELRKFMAARPRSAPLEIRRTATPADGQFPAETAWRTAQWTDLTARDGQPFAPSTRMALLHDAETLYFKCVAD